MVIVIVDNILNKCDNKITDTNNDYIYNNKDNKNKELVDIINYILINVKIIK